MGRREKYIPAQTGCSNFWCPTSLGNRYYFMFLHNNDQQNMPLLTSDSTKFPRKKLITGKERISSSRMDSSTQQVAKKQPFRVESTILSSATNQVGGVGVLDTREILSPLPPLSNESPFHFLRVLQSLTTIRFASIQEGGEDGLQLTRACHPSTSEQTLLYSPPRLFIIKSLPTWSRSVSGNDVKKNT